MDTMELINASAGLCSLLMTVMLLIAVMSGGNLGQRVYRWFFITLLLNLLIMLVELSISALEGRTGPLAGALIRAMDYLTYLVGGVQHVAFSLYIYAYLSMKKRSKRRSCTRPLS